MTRVKKILFIINGLGFGGAETQLIRLSKALAEKGHQIGVITLTKDLALIYRLDKRIKHINIPLSKFKIFSAFYQILKTVKSEQPDVIHAHLFQANIISRIVKMFYRKIRVINTTHGSYLLNTRSYNPYKIYRFTKKWVDFHTAVSNEVLELLLINKSINKEKSVYIPNGLFVKEYHKNLTNNNVFKWLAIGRFHPVKDYTGLIIACDKLKKQNVNFELHIVGDGEEKDKIENLIKECELSNHVKLLGIRNDIPDLLAQYDAFVISSYSEGLPMVLLEAMSASLPIVSTDVGEIGDIIKKTKGGLIVPPKNHEALFHALVKVINYEKKELIEMGNKNRIFVENNYDIEKISQSWINIYNL